MPDPSVPASVTIPLPMSMTTAWLILIVAGIFEIGMAIALKHAGGFTKLVPSLFAMLFGGLSMLTLSIALKGIPMSVAYAAWTGIGSVGVAIVGMAFFKEAASVQRIACVVLIVLGVAGLRMLGGEPDASASPKPPQADPV